MSESTNATGQAGEDTGVAMLREAGFQVLDRNFRCRYGEVDAVARDGDTIVFVEIKTRKTGAFGSPQEAVTGRKQARIARVAAQYLKLRGWLERPVRFDVIALGPEGREHLRDAFRMDA